MLLVSYVVRLCAALPRDAHGSYPHLFSHLCPPNVPTTYHANPRVRQLARTLNKKNETPTTTNRPSAEVLSTSGPLLLKDPPQAGARQAASRSEGKGRGDVQGRRRGGGKRVSRLTSLPPSLFISPTPFPHSVHTCAPTQRERAEDKPCAREARHQRRETKEDCEDARRRGEGGERNKTQQITNTHTHTQKGWAASRGAHADAFSHTRTTELG